MLRLQRVDRCMQNSCQGGCMMLAKDPFILLSIVNTKLRDRYSSLDELCKDMNEEHSEIIDALKSIGYSYDRTQNSFKAD